MKILPTDLTLKSFMRDKPEPESLDSPAYTVSEQCRFIGGELKIRTYCHAALDSPDGTRYYLQIFGSRGGKSKYGTIELTAEAYPIAGAILRAVDILNRALGDG